MIRKAVIFGIKSYKLTKKEKLFFKKNKPWGIILFSRNIKDYFQLKSLINEIKFTLKDKNYPILIDQEGGTVCRLNSILDLSMYSQKYFGKLYKKNKESFLLHYEIYINKVCVLLKSLGININTIPVLDVIRKNSNKVIKKRSFSSNSNVVSQLGKICISFYEKNKVATVIKHIPGHGPSTLDSHFKTPIVKLSKVNLKKKDFKPFKLCNSQFAMTAHIIYHEYDKVNTATHSKIVIKKVIRNYINFKGVLMSDDISMKALKYNLKDNAMKALQAGCNLIMHCNGNFNEMNKLAKHIPKIDNFMQKKTSQFYKFLM
jgi:beta-N-acetylhexosaminidase